ncbi:AMP-binding protein [Candidatus Solincola sp.]|nr:AMP-binding protein [Actinomycetota bacterium]
MDMPWLEEDCAVGIPTTLEPYPEIPTHHFLDHAADKYPKMGCVQLGLELSYRDLKEKADRLVNALRELGVDKGDRVATMLPISMQFLIADTGISPLREILWDLYERQGRPRGRH